MAASDSRGEANVRCLVSARQPTHPTLVPEKKLNARPGATSRYNSTGKVMNRSVDDKIAPGIASRRGELYSTPKPGLKTKTRTGTEIMG